MKKFIVLAMVAAIALPSVAMAQKTTVQSVTRTRTYKTSLRDISVWYQGELSVGFATGGRLTAIDPDDGESEGWKTDFSRPLIETVHGLRITNYGYVGLGLGLQYNYGAIEKEYPDDGKWNTMMMPLFVNLKGYYPVSEDFAPYLTLSLGGSAVLFSNSWWVEDENDKLNGGFYCKFGAGINYKNWVFDLGVMHQDLRYKYRKELALKMNVDSFYLNVGVKF